MIISPQNLFDLGKQLTSVYKSTQKLETKRREEEYEISLVAENIPTSSSSSDLPPPAVINELAESLGDFNLESVNLLQDITQNLLQIGKKGIIGLSENWV